VKEIGHHGEYTLLPQMNGEKMQQMRRDIPPPMTEAQVTYARLFPTIAQMWWLLEMID